ncbi:MAG: hypothetical protein JXX28_03160 [Deltaproteobacteria bacterium]|nr:hypothetical protein [Deltaproteobacteria bacterium]
MGTKADSIKAKKRARQKKTRQAAQASRGSRPGTSGPTKVRLDVVRAWPVWECYLSENWHEQGATVHAIITRRSGQGALAVATVQADLGVRGVVEHNLVGGLQEADLNRAVMAMSAEGVGMVMREPELVAKVLTTAAAYGVEMGFELPKGWERVVRFIDDIDVSAASDEILTGIPGAPEVKPGMLAGLRQRLFGG